MFFRSVSLAMIFGGWVGVCDASEHARTIFAVNAPLAHFAEHLGGDEVQVIYPVPAEVDPAFWVPGYEDVLAAQDADLILLNGAGYANWVKSAVLPRSRIIVSSNAFNDRLIEEDAQTHQHGPEGEHATSGRFAFTTWLDPDLALLQLEAAAQAMAARWPELEQEVGVRQIEIASEIMEMGADFETFFERVRGRQLFTSHPVYQYLERRYAQSFVALHWEPDADPGEAEWARFQERVDPDQRPLMIWEGEPASGTILKLKALNVDWVVLSPMANASDLQDLFSAIGSQVADFK